MNVQFTENLLVEMYVELDDLLKAYEKFAAAQSPDFKRRNCALKDSEVGVIIVMYQLSGYKCFEYYYKNFVLGTLITWFPNAPSYKVFLRYINMSLELVHLWLLLKVSQSKHTGTYFIDSKKLEVCHIKRAHNHQVFDGLAKKGKTSTGWFYGLKIHLIINDLGEIMNFRLTSGNVADNNKELLKDLFNDLQGVCVGDKGYQSTLFQQFLEQGLHLVVKPKKSSKNKNPELDKLIKLSRKRALIESVFDITSSVLDIEHTRHRSPINGCVHILSALIAYQYMERKPSIFLEKNNTEKQKLA